MSEKLQKILNRYHPREADFHQAVWEIYQDIETFYLDHDVYTQHQVLEQLLEPDRLIRFRVAWEDDQHNVHINRGWRVQYQNILGPYKGGLRFEAGVNDATFKFLGFEQCFKNSLTNLPIGGAKGGADFNPKDKSDHELRRFCWAFIEELRKYIGQDIDIPAGDIGVGVREIGYMYGHYIKLEGKYTEVFTGKGIHFGGTCGRQHATGYGCIYFLKEMLNAHDDRIDYKKIAISGSGHVALYAAEKCLMEKAKVMTLSDRGGTVYFKAGLHRKWLDEIKDLKFNQRGSLAEWTKQHREVSFHKNKKPWEAECDVALPCATQNEMNEQDVKNLINNGVQAICEGANMPLTTDALKLIQQHKNILYGPGKAANAGGVAVSFLEQLQNLEHITGSFERVDKELQGIMQGIHARCMEHLPPKNGVINYKKGANLWAFKRLADALIAYGIK